VRSLGGASGKKRRLHNKDREEEEATSDFPKKNLSAREKGAMPERGGYKTSLREK